MAETLTISAIEQNTTVQLSDYKPHPRNYNRHPETQVQRIAKSLDTFGQVRSIVVWRDYVLAGHGVREAALALGWTELQADVLPDDYSEELALAYVVADNELSRLADPDLEQLVAILEELKQADPELVVAAGYDDAELAALVAEVTPSVETTDTEPQIDRAEELREKWGVETGQLWQLGEHRLICGDCTDADVVERVVDGEPARLLVTSPPYWVGKEYETEHSEKEIDAFIGACTEMWDWAVKRDYGRIVINTGTIAINRIDSQRPMEVLLLLDKWAERFRKNGWVIRHIRSWIKPATFPGSVPASQDIISQGWEFIATFWHPESQQRGQERIGTPWAQQGVWSDVVGDRSAGGTHVAAFPVEIPARNIMLYSQPGETVFEPFSGSGTTIIACENLGRKCRGIEISPAYVAVSLERWADHTGQTPILVAGE